MVVEEGSKENLTITSSSQHQTVVVGVEEEDQQQAQLRINPGVRTTLIIIMTVNQTRRFQLVLMAVMRTLLWNGTANSKEEEIGCYLQRHSNPGLHPGQCSTTTIRTTIMAVTMVETRTRLQVTVAQIMSSIAPTPVRTQMNKRFTHMGRHPVLVGEA